MIASEFHPLIDLIGASVALCEGKKALCGRPGKLQVLISPAAVAPRLSEVSFVRSPFDVIAQLQHNMERSCCRAAFEAGGQALPLYALVTRHGIRGPRMPDCHRATIAP